MYPHIHELHFSTMQEDNAFDNEALETESGRGAAW